MVFLRTAIDAWKRKDVDGALGALTASAVPYSAGGVAGWSNERLQDVERQNFVCLIQSSAGLFWLASNEWVIGKGRGFPVFYFREIRDFFRQVKSQMGVHSR